MLISIEPNTLRLLMLDLAAFTSIFPRDEVLLLADWGPPFFLIGLADGLS